jgi:signal transduction histidine kinase
MPLTAILKSRGAREALWLTAALWVFCYGVFLLPSVTKEGGAQAFVYPMFALIVAFGPVISFGFYLLLRGTERWPTRTRVVLLAVGVLAAATAHSMIDAQIMKEFIAAFAPTHKQLRFGPTAIESFLIYIWLYGLYATSLGLMLSTLAMQERERQLAEAKSAAHQAQLAALRFQLNPHFLFNTLNAISSLIVTGRNGEAESMTAKLSDFLRSSLASDPQSVIPLDEELAAVGAYLDIESVRFGERLHVEVVCPPDLRDALTPSFVLQPIVENAVKYAVAPARRPVHIEVTATHRDGDLLLIVQDDGEGRQNGPKAPGTGVGLQNVSKRLEVLYGPRGTLEAGRMPGGGYRAVLRFPLDRAAAETRRVA